MKINILKKLPFFALVLALVTGGSSCSKEDRNGLSGGEVKVEIGLVGMEDYADGTTKDNSTKSRASAHQTAGSTGSEVFRASVPYNDDYHIVATVFEENGRAVGNATKSPRAALTPTPTPTTTTQLGPNVKYLVMVFDENGDRIVAQEKVYDSTTQSNANNQMILNAGKSYTFIAVSNKTSTAPTFNPAVTKINDVINTILVDNTSDYLYFNSGPRTIVWGQQNYIGITFKGINSRVKVNLNTSFIGQNITAANVGIQGSGAVNLAVNGTVTPITGTTYTKSFVFPTLNSQNITSNALVVSSAGKAHTLNINSLTTGGGTKSNLLSLAIPAGTFQKGVNYTLKLKIEPDGVIVGNVVWAKGNLAYNFDNDTYFIRDDPSEVGASFQSTDYWHYGYSASESIVPQRFVSYWTDATTDPINTYNYPVQNGNDPCRKVAGGLWRTPSIQDFDNLGSYDVRNNDGSNVFFNGNINSFICFPQPGQTDPFSNDVLKFYPGGRYYGTSALPAPWFIDRIEYMASDAHPFSAFGAPSRPRQPTVYSGASTGGTFLTQRVNLVDDTWSADDRAPIRCVRSK